MRDEQQNNAGLSGVDPQTEQNSYCMVLSFSNNLHKQLFLKVDTISRVMQALQVIIDISSIIHSGNSLKLILNSFNHQNHSIIMELLSSSQQNGAISQTIVHPDEGLNNTYHILKNLTEIEDCFQSVKSVAELLIRFTKNDCYLTNKLVKAIVDIFPETQETGETDYFSLIIPYLSIQIKLTAGQRNYIQMVLEYIASQLPSHIRTIQEIEVPNHCRLSHSDNHFKSQIDDYEEKTLEQKQIFVSRLYSDGLEALGNFRYSTAIDYLTEAVSMEPNESHLFSALGFSYFLLKKYDDAVKCFKTALTIFPGNIVALMNLGNVYMAKCEYDEAVKYFNEITILDSEFAPAYHISAVCYLKKGHYQKSLEYFIKAAELSRHYSAALMDAGIFFKENSKFNFAIESYQNLIRIYPDIKTTRMELAKIYYLIGNYHSARETLLEEINRHPKNSEAWELLNRLGKNSSEKDINTN